MILHTIFDLNCTLEDNKKSPEIPKKKKNRFLLRTLDPSERPTRNRIGAFNTKYTAIEEVGTITIQGYI